MKSALVVYSGGKPFDFEKKFLNRGFGLTAMASHRIDVLSMTPPAGSPARIIFTSRNALSSLLLSGVPMSYGAKVHAAGPATRAALEHEGFHPEDEGEVASTQALLASLPADLSGELIFWPRGDDADLSFAKELERRGAHVVAPITYRKAQNPFPGSLAPALSQDQFAVFACTSPAAVEWLFSGLNPILGEKLQGMPAACLGGSTRQALEAAGVRRISASSLATFDSLATRVLQLLFEFAGEDAKR